MCCSLCFNKQCCIAIINYHKLSPCSAIILRFSIQTREASMRILVEIKQKSLKQTLMNVVHPCTWSYFMLVISIYGIYLSYSRGIVELRECSRLLQEEWIDESFKIFQRKLHSPTSLSLLDAERRITTREDITWNSIKISYFLLPRRKRIINSV